MTTPGLIIGAPASGTGKTLITLGLIAALRREGDRPATFKVGPDYIDPRFHERAGAIRSPNLDSWAMRLETFGALADGVGAGADIVIGEGVMGLFDGAWSFTGSTGEIASMLDLPVVLVVDASGMGPSAAALVEGFIRHRDDVEVAGVIFNRVVSPRHAEVLTRACDNHFAQPVIGCLPPSRDLKLPSRHLGLIQASEIERLDQIVEAAASLVREHLDLDRLRRLARPFGLGLLGPKALPLRPPGQRIAVAQDVAFAFTYGSVLDGWREAGAEVLPFSPLANERPDLHADAVYLPGGYPELHAGRLAANRLFLDGLRTRAEAGAALYGECGGYMVLGEQLIDGDGNAHAMAGLLPVETSFATRRLHLGYRQVTATATTPLGAADTSWRGHEFHYATLLRAGGEPVFEVRDGRGKTLGPQGSRQGKVLGSFIHLIDRHLPRDDLLPEL